jgi:hypothetical protein
MFRSRERDGAHVPRAEERVSSARSSGRHADRPDLRCRDAVDGDDQPLARARPPHDPTSLVP